MSILMKLTHQHNLPDAASESNILFLVLPLLVNSSKKDESVGSILLVDNC